MPYLASAILMYIHYIIIPIFPCIERRFLELKKKTSIDMLKRGQIMFTICKQDDLLAKVPPRSLKRESMQTAKTASTHLR